MANLESTEDRLTKRMRLIARIWGAVIIAFVLVFAIGHIFGSEPALEDYPPAENLLPIVMLISVAGLGIALRWEGLGATINIGFFMLNLVLYWIIRGKFFPLGGLFTLSAAIIPGFLFLACWWRSRETNRDQALS